MFCSFACIIFRTRKIIIVTLLIPKLILRSGRNIINFKEEWRLIIDLWKEREKNDTFGEEEMHRACVDCLELECW